MKKNLVIFFVVLYSNCIIAQINSSNFVGSYSCTLTQWYSGSLTTIPNRTINIGPGSANDYFLFDDGNFITSSGYYKLNNDSTYFDTLGASGTCRYGKFYHQDSIYYYMCASSGQWSKYYGKKINPTGLNELKESSLINIYPNPSNSKIIVDITNLLFKDENKYLNLKNTLGQTVLKMPITNMQTEIDVSSFNEGIYFIEISTIKGILSKKIIVSK